MVILRTKCNYNFPGGGEAGPLTLPINHATQDSETWAWKYFWRKTLNSYAPITQEGGIAGGSGSFTLSGSGTGQTVLRAAFAYISSQAVSCSINLSVTIGWWGPDETGRRNLQKNIRLMARLYTGSSSQSLIDTTNASASITATLPATACPKVLWLAAQIQPTGEDPCKSASDEDCLDPPGTQAKIVFSGS